MLKRLRPLAFLFGILILAALLWRLDLASSWLVLMGAHPVFLLLAVLALFPEVLIKGWRLKTLAGRLGSRLTFSDAVQIYLSGQPLASLTPAKLGDVVRVVGLGRRASLPTAPALAVHVADKLYDLASLALWAAVGLLTILLEQKYRGPALAALAGILLGGVLVAFITNRDWVRSVAKPMVFAMAPAPLARELHKHGRQFYDAFPALLTPASLVTSMAQSLAAWTFTVGRACLCAKALSLALPNADLFLLLPAVIMVEFLPVSIMGFGTREAALFLFFASPVLSKEALLSFSLLTVAVGPALSALIGIPAAAALSAAGGEKR